MKLMKTTSLKGHKWSTRDNFADFPFGKLGVKNSLQLACSSYMDSVAASQIVCSEVSIDKVVDKILFIKRWSIVIIDESQFLGIIYFPVMVVFGSIQMYRISNPSKRWKFIEDYCMVTPHFTQQLITQSYKINLCRNIRCATYLHTKLCTAQCMCSC